MILFLHLWILNQEIIIKKSRSLIYKKKTLFIILVQNLIKKKYILKVLIKKFILNKLKDIVNNNKEENFTFIIENIINENINESTKIGIKKLHFI